MPNRRAINQVYAIKIIDHTWNHRMSRKGFEFDADLALYSSDPTHLYHIFILAHNHK